jgi:DNA-binding transcriptional regulator YdaS (Cro superfamily)
MEIQKIIEKAGGARAVAERLEISTQAVYKWKRVPAEHARTVAKMAKIKARDVREDVFG